MSFLALPSLLISLSPTTDGPRPTQKEIISLRAFMLLFLKQLILKVKPPPVFLPPSLALSWILSYGREKYGDSPSRPPSVLLVRPPL